MALLTNQEVIDAVLAWVEDVVPAVAGRTYDYVPAAKPKGLPDVAMELTDEHYALDAEDFPWTQIQQTEARVLELVASFMVAAGRTEPDAVTATRQLRMFAQALGASARTGVAIGPAELLSIHPRFGYAPPFVTYEDGTRGREMSMSVSVAQLVEAMS